jgi:hypothetical protein
MAKPQQTVAAAERKLADAFAALETELDAITPAVGKGGSRAIDDARSALNTSVARLREAVGKI